MRLALTPTTSKRILILGGGFGGLYTAIHLAKLFRRSPSGIQITLIDRNNYFLFSPLLHAVIPGRVEMHHVVHPIRHFSKRASLHFHETEVRHIDLPGKIVQTTNGDFSYDVLVLALGSVNNYFGNEAIARHAFPMKTLEHAVRLRNHIIVMLEAACQTTDRALRRRLLTFVQVGAGFTGLETITELHDFLHAALRKDYPALHPDELRLLLVDALPGLPTPSDPGLLRYTTHLIQDMGIECRFNTTVADAGAGWVSFVGTERLETNTLIWSAGVMANPLLDELPVERGSGKRIAVLPTLQLSRFPEVFALGDCALTLQQGKPLATTAQVANQQAPVVAENIAALLAEKPLRNFTFHRLGELATLGEKRAIAEMGPLHIHGFIAWWIWWFIYLIKLPCWEMRARIFADLKVGFFFPRDTSRIEADPNAEFPPDDSPE